MANKKIKQIKFGTEDPRDVYDIESTHSINGYNNTQVETQEVTFANVPISEAEIDAKLAEISSSN